MLHLETVDANTFSLLEKLSEIPELKDFSLVGGTALSLLYGHRISIDIDLFSFGKFDKDVIIATLTNTFGASFEYEGGLSDIGLFCFIEDVKVDLVHYPHPIIFETEMAGNIRMYAAKEIAAMKIQAILGRGRKKDFWDLAELFQHFTLAEIISFHALKYPTQQLLISIPQSLTYFTDANESEDPVSLKGQTWESVQQIIKQKVSEYLQ